MNTGVLNLTFSETVNISSFMPLQITLLTSAIIRVNNPAYNITKPGGVLSTVNSPVLSFKLDPYDLAAVKYTASLYKIVSSSYIIFTNRMIRDMAGNYVVPLGYNNASLASDYIYDTISPNLLGFTLNKNTGQMILTFDEPVASSTLTKDSITLYNSAVNVTRSYTLEPTNTFRVLTSLGMIVTFNLSEVDQVQLKAYEDFATITNTTYLTATSTLVVDNSVLPNNVNPILATNPLMANAVVPDVTPPYLVEFTELDLNKGTLTLSFDEPVNASSVQFGLINVTLVRVGVATVNVTLSSGVVSYVDVSNPLYTREKVVIQMSLADLLALKQVPSLVNSFAGSSRYITIARGAIFDMSGNPVLPRTPLTLSNFILDTTGPTPLNFSIDMNRGILVLTFSDVVSISSLQVSGLQLQAYQTVSGSNANSMVALSPQLWSTVTNSTNGYVVTIAIPTNDLNAIKATGLVATSLDTSFLAVSASTVLGINTLPAIAILSSYALPAGAYVPDTTRPQLVSFFLNISGNGVLSLTFSETVDTRDANSQLSPLPSLNTDDITLVGLNNQSFVIQSTIYARFPPSVIVNITLGVSDLNVIKALPDLASNSSNTFITITNETIYDMSGNPVVPITASRPLSVKTYVPDRTLPILTGFDLDMNTGVVTLSFSETVNGSSLNTTGVTFRADTSFGGLQYPLTGGLWDYAYSNIIPLRLSTPDLNALKLIVGLADSSATTYLALAGGTIYDMKSNNYSNPVVAIPYSSALVVGTFTPDATSPYLVSYSLNLTAQQIRLTFDETVNSSSFMVQDITLLSGPVYPVLIVYPPVVLSGNGTDNATLNSSMGMGSTTPIITIPTPPLSVTLTFGTQNASTYLRVDSTVLMVSLGPDDLNIIAALVGLATSINNTFISLPATTVQDMNLNYLAPVNVSVPQQVASFYPDLNPPRLVRFDLDLTREVLLLTFSKVINASTLNLPQFTLQGTFNATNRMNSYTLTAGTFSTNYSTQVAVHLDRSDLNEIKRLNNLATSVSNTFLTMTTAAVRDMYANKVVSLVNAATSLQVTLFTADAVPPQLVAFDLDMNTGTMALYFSETVRASTFNASALTLQSTSSTDLGTQQVTFNYTTQTFSPNSFSILVNISRSDLNAIKYLLNLAKESNETFLSLTSWAITDMNANRVVAISSSGALPVLAYTPDVAGPVLQSFDLDLNMGVLTLHFDETVNVTSLMFDLLTVQSSLLAPIASYMFLGGLVLGTNSPDVSVLLDSGDLDQIKLNTQLATNVNNTYLTLMMGAVVDMSLYENEAVFSQLKVSKFTPDTTSPQLIRFNLDLTAQTILMYFSEPMNTSSFNPIGITFINAPGGNSSYTLTAGNTSSSDGTMIVVNLDLTDLNRIKALETLAINAQTTYISIQPFTISDMNKNRVVLITRTNPLNVSYFTNDTIHPRLVAFDLDMNTNILTLQFVETVNTMSTNFTGITIQDTFNASNQFTLTGGTLLSLNHWVYLTVLLTLTDLNALKAAMIALTNQTTWLTMSDIVVLDEQMQPNYPLYNGITAMRVRNFTRDTTPPVLQSFDLNLSTNQLVLSFSETVMRTSLVVSKITISAGPSSSYFYTLSQDPGLASQPKYSPVVVVPLSTLDLNRIKQIVQLATSMNNTYLYVQLGTVLDMSSNPSTVILASNSQQVLNFVQDLIPPALIAFDLDMNSGTLLLFFSETINPVTIDLSQFVLQSSSNGLAALPFAQFAFSGGFVVPGTPNPNVTVQLNVPDQNEIKRLAILATSTNTTFIHVAAAGVQDMNRNYIMPITLDAGIQVSAFVPDTIPPQLVAFDLNLVTEQLTLYFSETVNASSLNVSGLTLLSARSGSSPRVRRLVGGTVLSTDSTVIFVQLGAPDLNYIKSISGFATSQANTYIVIDNYTIFDMSANPIVAIGNGSALQVSVYTADTVRPVLIAFSLHMNTGTLYLTYNETVNTTSLRVQSLTLQTSAMGGPSFSFNPQATASLSPYGTVVTVMIGNSDLNVIKYLFPLATSSNTTFLSISQLAINDTSGNPVVPSTLQVSAFTADSTPPIVQSFALDLNLGQITFNFSETVNVSSFNLTELTLQSTQSGAPGISVALHGGAVLTTVNSPTVTIQLLPFDLNLIKSFPLLGTGVSSTYLAVTPATIRDMNGNSLVAVNASNALVALSFVKDTTSPVLNQFSLDMNTGILALNFSETVNGSSLSLLTLVLQNAPLGSSAFIFTLSSTWTHTYSTIIEITFSKVDLDTLKQNIYVAKNASETYITVSNTSILDMSGNRIVPILNGSAQQVTQYISDVIPPSLIAFNWDVNVGVLTLFYSETIDIFSLRTVEITLQSGPNASFVLQGPNVSVAILEFTLTGGYVLPQYSTVAHINVTIGDLNIIKQLAGIATCTRNDTFIAVYTGQVLDMNGNELLEVSPDEALQVSLCLQDTTPPRLVNFTLDMNIGLLKLTFDETINSSSLLPSEITFHASPANSSEFYRLTMGSVILGSYVGQVAVSVNLTNADLNELKRRTTLAISASHTWVSITALLVRDMNKNPNVPIAISQAIQAAAVVPDKTSPQLLSFQLDLTHEWLTLSFSETVNTSSLQYTGITIQDQNITNSRTLVGGSYLTPSTGGPLLGPNDPVIVIQLSQLDLNYIKIIRNMATNVNNTYLSIQNFTIRDMYSNAVIPIASQQPLKVSLFVPDYVDPQLLSFDLNLTSNKLYLTFSETVDVSTLSVKYLVIQANASLSMTSIPPVHMTPGNTSLATSSASQNWLVIVIDLGTIDLNEIKRLRPLATSNITTFLSLTNQTIVDMNGNPVVPITTSNATMVTRFTADIIPPIMVRFSLDVNVGVLTLTFDETVDYKTTNFTYITLQNSPSSSTTSLTLTGGRANNTDYSVAVYVILTTNDLNNLKRIHALGTSLGSTFLSILKGTVLDMNSNPSVPISYSNAFPLNVFVQDSTSPQLVSFTLNRNTGSLYLTFDETVNASSLQPTQLKLQSDLSASNVTYAYTLTGGSSSVYDSTVLVVNLTFFDLNEIKKIRGLATSVLNTFISVTNHTVLDMNGNSLIPISVQHALQASNFTNDTTRPVLLSFNLDMNVGVLELIFSETVDSLTFTVTQFTLQSAFNVSDAVQNYTLMQPDLLTGDEVILRQGLLYIDLNTIKSYLYLATNVDDSFLSITSLAVKDMSGNRVVPISAYDALQVDNFTSDVTKPYLVSYSLDMNTGVLSLTFSETVSVRSLNTWAILISNRAVNASQNFVLTTNSYSLSPDWPIINVTLGASDLNALKQNNFLAISNTSTFLTLYSITINDTSYNSLLPISALPVSLFTPDITMPRLVSFDLDTSLNILTLHFSETVNGYTFNPTQITLVNMIPRNTSVGNNSFPATPLINYTLTGGQNLPLTVFNTTLSLKLSFVDRNNIEILPGLAVSKNTTFVSITQNMIADMSNNSIVAIPFSSPLPVSNFVADRTPPQLMTFDLNMDTLTLTLHLSKSVNVSSLNVSAITLQSTQAFTVGSTLLYALTSAPVLGSSSMSGNGPDVVINIGSGDANAIKFLIGLARGTNSTYLSLTSQAVIDMSGNNIVPILKLNATQVTNYVRDMHGSILAGFSLNLTSQLLVLTFDETVNVSSVTPMYITLQNSFNASTSSYTLSQAAIVGINSNVVVFNLTAMQSDLNALQLLTSLATMPSNTYIALKPGALYDLSVPPNTVLPTVLAVSQFFPDLIPPQLLSFDFNANLSTMTLRFSEVMNSSSIRPLAITLQSNISLPAVHYTLKGNINSFARCSQCAISFTTSALNFLNVAIIFCKW